MGGDLSNKISLTVSVPRTERLDIFIADQLSLSRTQAARWVAEGKVLVNGEKARRSRKLQSRDLIDIDVPPSEPPRHLSKFDFPLNVIFEDEELLVVDKPAGLVVHPAPGHWQDTLVNALLSRGTQLPGEDQAERAGIVHRLDKNTSGLMVVAKTDESHRKLGLAIQRRDVQREYAALVWGHPGDRRDIEAPIARHPGDRKRMMVDATGKEAITSVRTVARFECADLVRIRLHTGRTHQIRVHMAYIGHPVVGDDVYGGGGARGISGPARVVAQQIEKSARRQALHAAKLAFKHPVSNESMSFLSDWPSDLNGALSLASANTGILDRENLLEYLGFLDEYE